MFLINKLYVNTFCIILHDKYESCVWFLSVNKCACIPNLCFNCWKLHTSCTTSQIHRKRAVIYPSKRLAYTQSSSNPRRYSTLWLKSLPAISTNLSRPEDPHSLRGRFSAARTHHTLCKFSDSSLRGGSHIYIGFFLAPALSSSAGCDTRARCALYAVITKPFETVAFHMRPSQHRANTQSAHAATTFRFDIRARAFDRRTVRVAAAVRRVCLLFEEALGSSRVAPLMLCKQSIVVQRSM